MPILGVIASSTQQGRASGPVSAYEPIAVSVVPTGGLTSITFAAIPQTYSHLQIRIFAKNGDGNPFGSATITANGNAGAFRHDIYGTGSSLGVSGISGQFITYIGGTAQFGSSVVDILDYSSAVKAKTFRSLCGVDNNGSGLIAFTSGLDANIVAVTSLVIASVGTTFAQYSSFALYGIRSN